MDACSMCQDWLLPFWLLYHYIQGGYFNGGVILLNVFGLSIHKAGFFLSVHICSKTCLILIRQSMRIVLLSPKALS